MQDRRVARESSTPIHDHPQEKPVITVKADVKHLPESSTDRSEGETSKDQHPQPNRRR